MISRQQILQRCYELKKWSFVAYIGKLSDDCHVVRLKCLEFEKAGLNVSIVVQDWKVYEQAGKLSALSMDDTIAVKELI